MVPEGLLQGSVFIYENIPTFRKLREYFSDYLEEFSENLQESIQLALKFSY